MGRPELPVDSTSPDRGLLASRLRELRRSARLTYDELAVKTSLSPATLKRAASGRSVPSWDTVEAFAGVCGGDLDAVRALWENARITGRGRLRELRRPGSPELITTRGALSEALEYFYERAGAPSLRRLQELAGGRHLLPVSSAARIVGRQALPASRQQCAAFLTACGITGSRLERWADAFVRITSSREAVQQPEDVVRAAWVVAADRTRFTDALEALTSQAEGSGLKLNFVPRSKLVRMYGAHFQGRSRTLAMEWQPTRAG
ncbi:helix-turn-helix transcriptional regulator [Streptomyces sp. NPDC000075]|uniref:helix-turn-helix domain-containing protein n=1 Tax=Streptomyces TaxID=1883 RepID=UPI0031D73AB0